MVKWQGKGLQNLIGGSIPSRASRFLLCVKPRTMIGHPRRVGSDACAAAKDEETTNYTEALSRTSQPRC